MNEMNDEMMMAVCAVNHAGASADKSMHTAKHDKRKIKDATYADIFIIRACDYHS